MATPSPKIALVLFAHGSRDPKWAEPFKVIQGLIRAQAPDMPVELAFLELMQPDIEACLSGLVNQGVTRVSIVPIFLAAGRHLREDLPALIVPIQNQYPDLVIKVTAPIGDIPEFQAAIAKTRASTSEPLVCHSERSEESVFVRTGKQILRPRASE